LANVRDEVATRSPHARRDFFKLGRVEHPRTIRSFVTRAGRITEGQQRALDECWPRYGVEFDSAQLLDLDSLFGRHAPRVVEIGFGNGENLAALAAAHRDRDYLGIEVHRAGVGRLMLAADMAQLTNVRIACHDAVEVLERNLAPATIDEMLILFPDPWHKKRHHKRRLIQAPFVELAVSRLKSGGVLRLATDWEPYAVQMLDVLSANPALENLAPAGGYIDKTAERITTRFEKRGQRLGHGVWDLAFRRK
jgi:tRNA (guanine-N7-)-methyltransferase